MPAIYATAVVIVDDDEMVNLESNGKSGLVNLDYDTEDDDIVMGALDYYDSEMDIGNIDDYRTGTTTCVDEKCNSDILE